MTYYKSIVHYKVSEPIVIAAENDDQLQEAIENACKDIEARSTDKKKYVVDYIESEEIDLAGIEILE